MSRRGSHQRNHKRNQPLSNASKARIIARVIRGRILDGETVNFADYDFYGDLAMTQLVLEQLSDLLECPDGVPF